MEADLFRTAPIFHNFHSIMWLPDSAHDAYAVYDYCKEKRRQGCFCETPCSDAKYGRTVHIHHSDNPRLFNIPPRDSKQWKKEYDRRTSVERSNKREKEDYKLEDGRHRSTKMWYCRLYGIMMLQHLDAWETPPVGGVSKIIIKFDRLIMTSYSKS